MIPIIIANKEQHARPIRELFWEYLQWGNVKLDEEFGFQFDIATMLEEDMNTLDKFMPPKGRLLLGYVEDQPMGIACLKVLTKTIGEVKRMYVRPQARNRGLGRALLNRLLEEAHRIGYERVRLDSARFMTEAHKLYRSAGFHEIEAYEGSEIPKEFQNHWIFMEMELPAKPEIASPTILPPTTTRITKSMTPIATTTSRNSALDFIIPLPVSVKPMAGVFTLKPTTAIYIEPVTAEVTAIGQYLADKLNPSTGYSIQVLTTNGTPPIGNIYLTTTGGDPALGEEGYELMVTPEGVTLVAYQPAGLFRGLQTLRQILPASIESSAVQPGAWEMPAGVIRDYPRFAWRGVMLDVARHFFSVADVKRYIDLAAAYKMNRFHLHLTDDQGWRIEIKSWPKLTTYGGSTEVGGSPGGYYTQKDYADIVAYAQAQYISIVPEIDMPGHTNAALASYPELNCDEVAPELYKGTDVGFSSLCIDKAITYSFIDDVIRELAAITPGAYIHIGGDEAHSTPIADYISFIKQVQTIVQSYNKQMIGWEEIAQAEVLPASVAQHWHSDQAQTAVQKGLKVIMSPASKAYLDMKYTASTLFGLDWAGYIDVRAGYTWDPATEVSGVSESNVLGLEAPLWSETIQNMQDIEFMAFPRLLGYAEIGWSLATRRNWDEYRLRLGAHGHRLT